MESCSRHYAGPCCAGEKIICNTEKKIEKDKGTEFARMWELYLAACAATFHNGIIDLHQILMSKGVNNDLPMIRTV